MFRTLAIISTLGLKSIKGAFLLLTASSQLRDDSSVCVFYLNIYNEWDSKVFPLACDFFLSIPPTSTPSASFPVVIALEGVLFFWRTL